MLEDARSDPSPGLVLTLASDLHPTAVPAVETLALACLPLGDATRKVLGSSLLRRVARRYRVPRERACRELLRERDELLAWDRRVWLPSGALRAAGVRGRFRPVIFDREALSSPRRGGLVRASEGAITRWAFA